MTELGEVTGDATVTTSHPGADSLKVGHVMSEVDPAAEEGVGAESRGARSLSCPARYHLNRAVKCYVTDAHTRHEGVYALPGRVVEWTDDDKRPVPVPPHEHQSGPTAMELAFERARIRR